MDTIDSYVMQEAEQIVHGSRDLAEVIHTVTVTLDGATGGAQVTMEGFRQADASEPITIVRQVS